jgi:hypothetical protein
MRYFFSNASLIIRLSASVFESLCATLSQLAYLPLSKKPIKLRTFKDS